MTNRTVCRRLLAICFAIFTAGALVTVGVSARRNSQARPVGYMFIEGTVLVNGVPASTGDIFSSGETIETTAHSSAVVRLGKLGRVEVVPQTTVLLRFDEMRDTITAIIDTGRVRVHTGRGVQDTVGCRE